MGWEDPLKEEMKPHFSIFAWEIRWTEEPGGLQSMGSQRVDTTEHTGMHDLSASPSSGVWTLLSVRRDGEWLATFLTDQL